MGYTEQPPRRLSQPSLLFAFDDDPLMHGSPVDTGNYHAVSHRIEELATPGAVAAHAAASRDVRGTGAEPDYVGRILAARRWGETVPQLSVEAFLRVCREGGLMGFDMGRKGGEG